MTVVFPPLEQLRLRRSAKWRTWPPDVLPLGVAEMDVELAAPVAEELREAIERCDVGYAAPSPDLGDALAAFADARWGWQVDPAAVVAVTDVGVGIVEVLRLLGGTVAFSPPVYGPFFEWFAEVGARTVEVPLALTPDGWRLDLPALAAAFSGGVSVYVLCNPHNPVGRVHAASELAELVTLARRHGVTIVSDEIHAPLALPGAVTTPILTVPGAADVAIAAVSASKAWNLAGLKCAALVTGSRGTRAILERLPPDARWRVGHLGVLASIAAYRHGGPWLDELLLALEERRTWLGEALATRLPQLTWTPMEATFLAWLDCSALDDATSTAQRVLDVGRVGLEPGAGFGAPQFVRLNVATGVDVLDAAVDGISHALKRVGVR